MIQVMKDGTMRKFETISEREKRLLATAEAMYSICAVDSLTISDYERTKVLLDTMVYGRNVIRDQSNI